jgi:hypothetical protein
MRSDIVPGSLFPDYELSDHTAKRRKLSELQGPHPMVLVLSRGAFCPKDRRQAELLVQLHREMEVGYCRLVTISTDNITVTNEYRTGRSSRMRDEWCKRIWTLRIHGPGQQSDDSPCHRSGAWPDHPQDIQRLLVLRPADNGRSPSGTACGHEKVPARLGHHDTGNAGRVEGRPQRALLPLW